MDQAASPGADRASDGSDLPPYDAFASFYADHYAEMVRLAVAVLRDGHAAEEATQDAFASLLGRWSRVDDPVAYLRRSVVNRCRDLIRREQSGRRLSGRLRAGSTLSSGPTSDPMDDAINRLGPDQRTAIVLRYYLGLSPDEIAAALGRKPSTVRSWLRRALITLKEDFRDD